MINELEEGAESGNVEEALAMLPNRPKRGKDNYHGSGRQYDRYAAALARKCRRKAANHLTQIADEFF